MRYSPPETNFTRIQNELSRDGHFAAMGGTAAMVYITILQNSTENNFTECVKSQKTLGEMIGVRPNTVGEATQKLEALGYIKVAKQKKQGVKELHTYTVLQLPKTAQGKKKDGRGKSVEGMATLTQAKQKKAQKVVEQRTLATQDITTEDKLYEYYLTIYKNAGGNNLDLYTPEQFRNTKKMKDVLKKYGEERITEAYRYIHNRIKNGTGVKQVRDFIFEPIKAITMLEDLEKSQEADKKRQLENQALLIRQQQEEEERIKRQAQTAADFKAKAIQLESEGIFSKEELEAYLTDIYPRGVEKYTLLRLIADRLREDENIQHAAD